MNNDNPWIAKWKNIARYLHVSVSTAKGCYYKEGLPVITGGNKTVRIRKKELDEFIERGPGDTKEKR